MSHISDRANEATFHSPAGLMVTRYRFTLRVRRPMRLPPYKGSVLRGGFGSAFRRVACAFQADRCQGCLLRPTCPYGYIFETSPPSDSEVLRTQEDIPRPFVIEPPEDGRTDFAPGDTLVFHLVLIGRATDYLAYFIVAFKELGRTGIGPMRAGFELERVEQVDGLASVIGRTHTDGGAADWMGEPATVPDRTDTRAGLEGSKEVAAIAATPNAATDQTVYFCREGSAEIKAAVDRALVVDARRIETTARRLPIGGIGVEFLTMTRLKARDEIQRAPEFEVLIRGLLRRISALAYFHHGMPLTADFAGLVAAASAVRLEENHTRWVDWTRYSNRQDAGMNLGGIVGQATYRGNLAPFRELLVLGAVLHVGKNTTFGLGRYRLLVPEERAIVFQPPSAIDGGLREHEG